MAKLLARVGMARSDEAGVFRIKICGIMTASDAQAAVAAGADAIGLNFVPASPRYIDQRRAAEIVASLPKGVAKVGVFVNSASQDIANLFDSLRLDLIQLHGDEPPALLSELEGRPVIKAFRPDASGLASIETFLDTCREQRCTPRAILLDARRDGIYGGTGSIGDWDLAAAYQKGARPPLVLAGGLTPDNVAAAIKAVAPSAVDAASGVEASPGVKDKGLMRRFAGAAASAFALLDRPATSSR